ncbi:hypothetical protein PRIPAC_73375, partial [Pristionchus pacificus]|uniref:Uncharacterized protein n=1 Tax=Pristionchus pacificus TaxID=54126 RepID=A0A2A6BGA8_PRIPA
MQHVLSDFELAVFGLFQHQKLFRYRTPNPRKKSMTRMEPIVITMSMITMTASSAHWNTSWRDLCCSCWASTVVVGSVWSGEEWARTNKRYTFAAVSGLPMVKSQPVKAFQLKTDYRKKILTAPSFHWTSSKTDPHERQCNDGDVGEEIGERSKDQRSLAPRLTMVEMESARCRTSSGITLIAA